MQRQDIRNRATGVLLGQGVETVGSKPLLNVLQSSGIQPT